MSAAVAADACRAAISAWSRYGPAGARVRASPIQLREAVLDQCAVPPTAILLLHRQQLAVVPGPGIPARVLQQEQRVEPGHLVVVGQQRRQQAGQPDRLRRDVRTERRAFRGGVALVEQQVDHGEHPAGPLGEPVRRWHPEGDARVLIFCLVRRSRLLIVASVTTNARATSRVERPVTVLSVSATRPASGSAGWQHMNSRASRSSPNASSSATGPPTSTIASSSRTLSCSRRRRRSTSSARRCAAVVSHAAGLSGTPSSGQRRSARSTASW